MNQDRVSYDHDNQVGGRHYNQGDRPQHWDLVVWYDWDYFQSQIVKYVMRWKDKFRGNPAKQLEDLKKARSFLDKYIDEYQAFLEPGGDKIVSRNDLSRIDEFVRRDDPRN